MEPRALQDLLNIIDNNFNTIKAREDKCLAEGWLEELRHKHIIHDLRIEMSMAKEIARNFYHDLGMLKARAMMTYNMPKFFKGAF